MFKQVLSGDTEKVLEYLKGQALIRDFYLAGGTGLALQLGHRLSEDLDFFTLKEFNEERLLTQIKKITAFKLEKLDKGTLIGNLKKIRLSFFYYPYPLLFTLKNFLNIKIATVADTSAMKLSAISARGTKRDFIDLYFICKDKFPLSKVFGFYVKKYKNLAVIKTHIIKSLVYFKDAESEPMPRMLRVCAWEEVKEFFEEEVKKVAQRIYNLK